MAVKNSLVCYVSKRLDNGYLRHRCFHIIFFLHEEITNTRKLFQPFLWNYTKPAITQLHEFLVAAKRIKYFNQRQFFLSKFYRTLNVKPVYPTGNFQKQFWFLFADALVDKFLSAVYFVTTGNKTCRCVGQPFIWIYCRNENIISF